jgi:transposase
MKRTVNHELDATVVRIGIDTSKKYVHLHGVNAADQPVLRKRLVREDVLTYFANLPACVIGVEACSGSHYWARELGRLGHIVRIMAAEFVTPYRKSQAAKNDANDAEAICEAASRPTMRFVAVKNEQQQSVLALHTARQGLIEHRTAVVNRLRGVLVEFGYWFPLRPDQLKQGVAVVLGRGDAALPTLVQDLVRDMLEQLRHMEEHLSGYDQRIAELIKQDSMAQRIRQLVGVGDITASAIVATIGDATIFRNGRQMGAWLGLTPRQYSMGGKSRLGKITKRGDTYLRHLLVQGARSAMQAALRRSADKQTRVGAWIVSLYARVGYHKTLVAIANKHARMIWAMMAKGENYDANAWKRPAT